MTVLLHKLSRCVQTYSTQDDLLQPQRPAIVVLLHSNPLSIMTSIFSSTLRYPMELNLHYILGTCSQEQSSSILSQRAGLTTA